MKIKNQLGKIKIKKLMSVVLTASIIVTSFSSVIQASAQNEDASSQVAALEEASVQTAVRPAEPTEEFVISSKYDLSKFMVKYDYWESNYKVTLACDIDMGGAVLNQIKEYSGIFDGQGHTISNFSVQDKSDQSKNIELAFIKTVNSSAQFKNVTFDNYSVECKSDIKKVAGFVVTNHGTISGVDIVNSRINNIDKKANAAGYVLNNEEDGIIENCFVNMSNKDAVIKFGFVGTNLGKITGCSTTLSVSSKDIAGGFCGRNSGEISNCKSEGNVTAKTNSKKTATICGGFVAENNGTIKESSSIGKVEGQEFAGGFVGINRDKSEIISCKSIGDVESKTW
ncbi:MAG: hypothetical protein K2G97_03485, partial [Oscillospiraceae bacterium]|nr:hypothetical protein [Oscillospiraceae bacterium]